VSTRRSIVIAANDKSTTAAVQRLTEWVRAGLVEPFVACIDDGPDMDIGRDGVENRPWFETLAREEFELVHVVALVGPDTESTTYVSSTAERIAGEIEALKPKGMRVVEVRIWSPQRDPDAAGVLSAPEGFYSPGVDANLVIIPEDRKTEAMLGVPHRRSPIRDVRIPCRGRGGHRARNVVGYGRGTRGEPGQGPYRLRPSQSVPGPFVRPYGGDSRCHAGRRGQPWRPGAGAQGLRGGTVPA